LPTQWVYVLANGRSQLEFLLNLEELSLLDVSFQSCQPAKFQPIANAIDERSALVTPKASLVR
jgi:hypothetical protein